MHKSNGDDGEISPLELESLANHGDTRPNTITSNNSLPSHPCDKLMLLIKLYFELYPKVMLSSSALTLGVLLWAWSPWQGWGNSPVRNYMTRDYTALTDNFNFQTAQIDHWCLFGGDDRCNCEDPTEGQSRSEVPGWSNAHNRNKQIVQDTLDKKGKIDVVFFGDQNVQSWDGHWLDKPCPEGGKIARHYNETFNSEKSDLQAVALGIYGDRLDNILWRMQHGEMPTSLNPKVFWLVMGTNDLALGMCSEEVVTLGIMRVAEEVHHHYPEAVVVVQGILPRSNHRDGSLDGKSNTNKHHYSPSNRHHLFPGRTNRPEDGPVPDRGGDRSIIEYQPMVPGARRMMEEEVEEEEGNMNPMEEILQNEMNFHQRNLEEEKKQGGTASSSNVATFSKYQSAEKLVSQPSKAAKQPYYDYYLWPSIQAINKELEGFCSKHDHFVYFDADNLVLGSIGNDYYRAEHKTIIAELMPNYVHLSALGHTVVMSAIEDELKRIVYDDDEANDIEKKGPKRS